MYGLSQQGKKADEKSIVSLTLGRQLHLQFSLSMYVVLRKLNYRLFRSDVYR
jgi:hypothetical protein